MRQTADAGIWYYMSMMMRRKAHVSCALTVDAHAAVQQFSASNRDWEEGCQVQEENERVTWILALAL